MFIMGEVSPWLALGTRMASHHRAHIREGLELRL